ncbi:kinase-like protein [Artomyces pyxidatus]|uniref:Kinase-like protein n=1 Tax=Artomyces pyxidatus TaxID=48021 RepID=A0ACB8SNT3_9AGAM|nr:kinase-like protein [Artomyces pyxidatus]
MFYSSSTLVCTAHSSKVNGIPVDRKTHTYLKDGDVLTLACRRDGPFAYRFTLETSDADHECTFRSLYSMGKIIGQGGFSSVYEALNTRTGTKMAVKVIRANPFPTKSTNKFDVLKEVKIMKDLVHPHVVQLEAVFPEPRHIYVVLELFPLGNLMSVIVSHESFSKAVVFQVNQALIYLHQNHIVHRDIKPENILIACMEPVHVKVADFGLATLLQPGAALQSICGTPEYMAPEVELQASKYNAVVDSWSLGVTLFVMLSGQYPWADEEPHIILWNLLPASLTPAGENPITCLPPASMSSTDLLQLSISCAAFSFTNLLSV